MNPAQKSGSNVVVFLFQVSEVGQTTIFDPFLVVIGKILIADNAEIVVMLWLVEGSVHPEVSVEVAHVVAYDINHHPNISLVTRIHQIHKLTLRTEVTVQCVDVPPPIPMIPSVAIVYYRRYPYCVESHSCDVIQIVLYSSVPSSTIVA